MKLSRRKFLELVGISSVTTIVASPLKKLSAQSATGQSLEIKKFGTLKSDPKGILDLPKGFQYRIISSVGETMNDGLPVPNNHDGMATFPGKNGSTILVRNHELHPVTTKNNLPADFPQYDPICPGGTTTIVIDRDRNFQQHYLSLAGTNRNCSGGTTPWGSWISCEEEIATPYAPPGYSLEQLLPYWGKVTVKHGYNFEVRATGRLAEPIPLKAMGRFRHEAIAINPITLY